MLSYGMAPKMTIEKRYLQFDRFETSVLGNQETKNGFSLFSTSNGTKKKA